MHLITPPSCPLFPPARRFKSDKIYTTCSDVLISINPYKRIPLLYDIDRSTLEGLEPVGQHDDSNNNNDHDDWHHHPEKKGIKKSTLAHKGWLSTDFECNRPHVYTIAARAHKHMVEPAEASLLGTTANMKNQSIIISGESGACEE